MYSVEYRRSVERQFQKMAKKNPKKLEIILTKIDQICQNPYHYKNLRHPFQHLKRVHVDSSFVIVYSVDETSKLITIEDYDHHDNIYRS